MFTPQMVFHLKNVLRILKTISGRSQRQTLGFLPRISPIPYGNLRMAPDRSILGRTFRYKESGADPHRETGRLAAMVMCQRGGVSCRLRHRNLPVKRITEPPPTNIYTLQCKHAGWHTCHAHSCTHARLAPLQYTLSHGTSSGH